MKAIVWTQYGPPEELLLMDVEKPVPKDNEILVKIHASSVTMGDCEMRMLKFSALLRFLLKLYIGFRKPKRIRILGQEFAGEIEALGKDAKLFSAGDHIFGATDFKFGGYAEYICVPESGGDGVVSFKPENLTFVEAAVVPTGGLNALHFLRKVKVQKGQKVLIIGAGGSIGTMAIQIAKHYGAEVTGVDGYGKRDMLRSIGADHVIDFRQVDFTKNGRAYDVIFDLVGKGSFSRAVRSLTRNGTYLLGNPKLSWIFRGKWNSMKSGRSVIGGTVTYDVKDLNYLKGLIEKEVIMPVIDRIFPLEQIVDAHRYVEGGQKKGNVVVSIN